MKTKISWDVTRHEIRFLEVSATKSENMWEYTATGSWFKQRPIGELSEQFLKKALELKNSIMYSEVSKILCSAAYAVDLVIAGVITETMINSIEEKVVEAGGAMTPLIIIPPQDITLHGEVLKDVAIVIVDCHSYSGFCFIGKNNQDL